MARNLRFAHADGRRRPYWRDERLLGKTFVAKQQEGILVIGRDVWTRQEIVEHLKCGNFHAAANLTKIARKLDVDSLDQLISRYSIEDLFAEVGVGITTMFVLMCAQESRKHDPMKWMDHKDEDIVTLSTEKHRAVKRIEDARVAKKHAKRANGNHA